MEAQNEALREIQGLMKRLEDAESLFPSSKAFAELYPLYNSPEFVGRVSLKLLLVDGVYSLDHCLGEGYKPVVQHDTNAKTEAKHSRPFGALPGIQTWKLAYYVR